MRRGLSLAAILSLGLGSSYGVDFRASAWPMRRTVQTTVSPALYEVPLDLDIQSRSRPDLLDLRVSGNNRLEPYVVVEGPGMEVVADIADPPGEIGAEARSSVYKIDFGRPLTFRRVEFSVADPIYNRVTRLETSADGKNWTFAGNGYIWRTSTQNSNGFTVLTQQSRYVRVSAINDGSVPLRCNRIRFLMPPRLLQFVAHGPGPFRLYYGAPGVHPALYDEAAIQAYREREPVRRVAPGPAEKNPAFQANPLREADAAYESKVRHVRRSVAWIGAGSVVLFAMLYLGYLMMEGRPRRRRRSRRRDPSLTP